MSEANAPLGSSHSQILTRRKRVALADEARHERANHQVAQETTACVDFYPQGTLVEVNGLPGWTPEDEGVGGTRKPIREFTWKQRRAVLTLLGKMDVNARPVFVTLTFPRECRATCDAAKESLRVFLQRFTREYDSLSVLWKMEPQRDGTPHFHCFFWGVGYVAWEKIAIRWAEVIANHYCTQGNGGRWWSAPEYLRPRYFERAEAFRAWLEQFGDSVFRKAAESATRIEAIRSENGVKCYAAKYIAKTGCEDGQMTLWEEPGRMWGVHRRDKLPWSRRVVYRVEKKVAVRFARTMKRWLKSKGLRQMRHVRRVNVPPAMHGEWLRLLCLLDERGTITCPG